MIANLGNIDHKIYKLVKNGYTLYSKLKYTTNKNLFPYCIGDWVLYSSNKCLVFSDSSQKDSLLAVCIENNIPIIKLINKNYIFGIVDNPEIESHKDLTVINVNKHNKTNIQLYSKNNKYNYGILGEEFEVKEPIYEFDCEEMKKELIHKVPFLLEGIPENFIIHGIVDYTAYHFHKPYRNEFFTQYNPFWDKLYHGVHVLWDKKEIDIKPNDCVSYSKIHVGDIFISNEGILHIASICNGKSGFYSFKHFQFHPEKYYENKAITLYAVNSKLNVIPLIGLLYDYGLSLGVKLDICSK